MLAIYYLAINGMHAVSYRQLTFDCKKSSFQFTSHLFNINAINNWNFTVFFFQQKFKQSLFTICRLHTANDRYPIVCENIQRIIRGSWNKCWPCSGVKTMVGQVHLCIYLHIVLVIRFSWATTKNDEDILLPQNVIG